MKYMSIGHKVIVHIPQSERTAHAPLVKYHEQEMRIANRVTVSQNYVYYELLGAESDFGIPYAFVREWLIPV